MREARGRYGEGVREERGRYGGGVREEWAMTIIRVLPTLVSTTSHDSLLISYSVPDLQIWAWPECKFLLGKRSILFLTTSQNSWAEL